MSNSQNFDGLSSLELINFRYGYTAAYATVSQKVSNLAEAHNSGKFPTKKLRRDLADAVAEKLKIAGIIEDLDRRLSPR